MSRIASEIIYKLTADDADLAKSFKDAESRAQRLGRAFTDVGKKLTIGLTLPIIGVGAAFIKLASDAEETNSKFDAVFKDQADTVRAWAEEYSTSVGRSATENIGFLATIQDTLVPLGLTRDAAAEVSKSVVTLATDLASFNNLPTEQVVRDIQSALVGNTETLRKYGVVASQEAIVQEALTSGLIKQATELDATSKAQAIYSLLVQGTSDAQGDAARTSESAANQLRALQSEAKELGEEFGKQLLPIFVDIVKEIRELVGWFSELDEELQRNIITAAGVVAALGPVLTLVGQFITIAPKLKAAFLLVTGPVGLVVTGIVAAGVALGALYVKGQQIFEQRLQDTYGEQAEAIGLTAQEAERLVGFVEELAFEFDALGSGEVSLDRIRSTLGQVAQAAGVSVREYVELALQTGNISDEFRAQLTLINRQLGPITAVNTIQGQIAGFQEQGARNTELVNQRLTEQAAIQAQINAGVEALYIANREKVVGILKQEQSEFEQIQAQIDELQRTPWATGQLETDRLAAIEVLRGRQAELIEAEKQAELKSIAERVTALANFHQQRLSQLAEEGRLKLEQDEAEKQREQEALKTSIDKWTTILSFASSALSQISNLQQQATQKELDLIDQALNARLEAEGLAQKTKIETLQASLDATKEKLAEETDEDKRAELQKTQSQLENDIRRQQITEEFEKKKADVVYKGQLAQWNLTKLQTIADGASAILKAATGLPWPLNLPSIGFASVLSGLQLAGVNNAKPVPQFATGGSFTVPQGFQNDSFPLAFAQSGERVTVETPGQAASADNRRGNTFVIEQVIATPGGLRELNRLLNKYGDIEQLRTGDV